MRDEKGKIKSRERMLKEAWIDELSDEEKNEVCLSVTKWKEIGGIFICYTILFLIVSCVLGYTIYQAQTDTSKIDIIHDFGKEICNQNRKEYLGTWKSQGNYIVECMDKQILVEVDKNGKGKTNKKNVYSIL